MSQASLYNYYSVCKRKADEPIKTESIKTSSVNTRFLPDSQERPAVDAGGIPVCVDQCRASQSVANALHSQLNISVSINKQPIDQPDTSSDHISGQTFVGKDQKTSCSTDLILQNEVSPFKVPTNPVPRRVRTVSRRRITPSSAGSNRSGSVGASARYTSERNQQSILKWAKRKQSEEDLAYSEPKSAMETPKRKRQEQRETTETDEEEERGRKPSSGRTNVRRSLADPLRAVQSGDDRELKLEQLIKCDESIEKPKNAADEKFELIGGCSNLAALRKQRLHTSHGSSTFPSTNNFIYKNGSLSNSSSYSSPISSPIQSPLKPSVISPTKEFIIRSPLRTSLTSPSKLEQIRERKASFGKCSNLTELQEKFAGARSFLKELKEFQAKSPVKVNLSTLTSPTKRQPESGDARRALFVAQSPKKLLEEIYSNSPIKLPPESRTSSGEGLTLPLKYKQLIDSFYCLDSVALPVFNRLGTIPFDMVQREIRRITKKNFELKTVAQILTIFPQSYSLKYEKRDAESEKLSKSTTTAKDLQFSSKNRNGYVIVLTPGISRMSPKLLKVRKNQFEERLMDFTKREHQKFLLSLVPPIEISPELLRKWHPSFRFPDIPEALMPQPPASENKKTIKEFLAKTSPEPVQEKPQTEKETSGKKITEGPLKGLSLALLEKIKLKQAALMAKDITRNPEEGKKLEKIKKLPELIRILHSYFVMEKKAAIPIEQVVANFTKSSAGLSVGDCNDYLYLLNELLPDWLFVLKVSRGTFIKIDKGKILEDLFKRLERITNRLKQN